jgi:nucleoid-associated protein YgaU
MFKKACLFSVLSLTSPLYAQDEDLPFEDFPDMVLEDELPEEEPRNNNTAQNTETGVAEDGDLLEELNEMDSEAPAEDVITEDSFVEEDESLAELEESLREMEAQDEMAEAAAEGAEAVDEEMLELGDESLADIESELEEEMPSVLDGQMEVTSPGVQAQNPPTPVVPEPTAPAPLLSQPTNNQDFTSSAGLFDDADEFSTEVQDLERRLRESESSFNEITESGILEPGHDLAPSEKFWRVPIRPQMSDANWLRWAGPMVNKEYNIRRGDSLWKVSERLFGTPYLWPKIWHLNASITNPHIIKRGMKLDFRPGNPGSAPEMAFRGDGSAGDNIALYPMQKLDKKRTLLEIIDATVRDQIKSKHPPFQSFLLYSKPEAIGEIPDIFRRTGRVFLTEGDQFYTSLADGVFPVVKINPIQHDFSTYYRVHWLGTLVIKNRRATLKTAFREIQKGALIINRSFRLSPLAIHEETLGPNMRQDTQLVSLQEGSEQNAGDYNLMGVRFPGISVGPRPGALMTLQVGHGKSAKALLIDRDQRTGTVWLLNTEQEVSPGDQFF